MRQQELHALSLHPNYCVARRQNLLYRLGLRPFGLGGIEGAQQGDYLVNQRLAIEQGKLPASGRTLSRNAS